MPRFGELRWFSPINSADAFRENAVTYDYCTATAVVFAYCASVSCKCRDL